MSSQAEVIETTVSQVAAELVRRGLDPDDRVTITIEMATGSTRSKVATLGKRENVQAEIPYRSRPLPALVDIDDDITLR